MENSCFYRHAISITKFTPVPFVLYMVKLLEEKNFELKLIDTEDGNIIYAISQKSEKNIFPEAQYRKIQKQYSKRKDAPYDLALPTEIIYHEAKKNFSSKTINLYSPELKGENVFNINLYSPNGNNNDQKPSDYGFGLFTEAEIQFLEFKILTEIEVDKLYFTNLLKQEKILYDLAEFKLQISESLSLFTLYRFFNFIQVTPLHYSNYREKITSLTIYSSKCCFNQIRNYYGDSVAIYYSYLSFYQKWLKFPSIFAVIIFILNKIYSSQDNFFYSVYAFFVILWSQLFIKNWDRRCSELEIEWDNYTNQYEKENTRSEFKGIIGRSLITEKEEKYFPMSRRFLLYLKSAIRAIPCLFLALCVMICFLNLNGAIVVESNSLLKIEYLAKLAREGGPLDYTSLKGKLVSIVIVVIIMLINRLYKKIAEETTAHENHQFEHTFENSLILKRFIFEFFNSFYVLFYLAFVSRNHERLTNILTRMFIINQLKRVFTETIFPCAVNIYKGNITRDNLMLKADSDRLKLNGSDFDKNFIIHQIKLKDYDTFDDFLTIVMEFGYLTIFASTFPFASVCIFLLSNVEMRSDCFKLGTIFKKPFIIKKKNIGVWGIILKFISLLSVFTNIMFYIITSKNTQNTIGIETLMLCNQMNIQNDFYVNLMTFFKIEHIIIFSFFILNYFYSSTPFWVNIFHMRRDYKQKTNRWISLLEGM